MKILFVNSKYYPEGAGSGRSVKNLAEALVHEGHEAVVVCLKEKEDKKPASETINGVKIYHLPIWNIYGLTRVKRPKILKLLWHIIDSFNPLAMHDLDDILSREKPDIVNTNVIAGFSAGIFKIVKNHNIPLVHTLRDYYLLCTQSGMFMDGVSMDDICPHCKPFIPMRRLWASYVDLFLANSDFVLKRHQSFNMIKPSQKALAQLNMNDDDRINKPKALPSDTIRFGYIGRLDPVKGVDVLLESLSMVKGDNYELRIAGNGEDNYVESLKAKSVPHPEKVTFLGHMGAIDFYKSIDVLICPSVYEEPLPRVVYEAYRHALPVIATNTGGTPEIVDVQGDAQGQDGEQKQENPTGFLYEPYDRDALAAHMQHFMDNPEIYSDLSKNASQKAKLFTPSAVAKTYLEKIQPLIEVQAEIKEETKEEIKEEAKSVSEPEE